MFVEKNRNFDVDLLRILSQKWISVTLGPKTLFHVDRGPQNSGRHNIILLSHGNLPEFWFVDDMITSRRHVRSAFLNGIDMAFFVAEGYHVSE